MRKNLFVNGEFYHIYNRGTDKRVVFPAVEDYDRFIQSMVEFNCLEPIGSIYWNSFIKHQLSCRTTKLVNIISYCLNPNHFHMILQQNADNGISEFMKRLGGYTRFINIKHKRSGVLFQGKFKSKHIDSHEYLLRVSSYVNLNNRAHRLTKDFRSSWDEYIGQIKKGLCSKDIILSQFKDKNEYKIFAEEALENILERKQITAELEN